MSNIMKIFDYYRQWRHRRAEEEKRNRRQEIQDEIRIKLDRDSLWLMVGNEAIYKASDSDTAAEIVKKAQEVYQVAKEYKEL